MLHFILITVYILLNAICLWSIHILIKDMDNLTWKSYLKYLSGIPIGAGLSLLLSPITVQNIILFALMGGVVGELLFLFSLTIKQSYKKKTVLSYYGDGSPAKIYITGDKHRHFDRVKEFCREMNTRRKDVLIILGDSGFNYHNSNRYRIVVSEDNGTKTAYCFGAPIYNRKTRKLVDLRFYENNGIRKAYGSNAEITASDGVFKENDEGFCKIRFPGEIVSGVEVRYGTAEISATLNGILVKVPCMADQPHEIRLLTGQPFMAVRANDRCFSLMQEEFKPFVTVSCIGVLDSAGQMIAPCNLGYQRNSDQEYSLTLYHTSPYGCVMLFEINLHEDKLFQDTTVESLHPELNNAFGGTAFIGSTAAYGEQWLYSRPDFSKLPELYDKQIRKAVLHLPRFGGNCALAALGLTARFCSFGSNWENKVQSAEELTDASESEIYQILDITNLITDRTHFLTPFEGLILKPKVKGSGFSAVSTGDSYFAPQILEVNFR